VTFFKKCCNYIISTALRDKCGEDSDGVRLHLIPLSSLSIVINLVYNKPLAKNTKMVSSRQRYTV